uniref:Uncharacterized protein n=1 Tax=Oryza nivara TaxID=4536 RepID=A0A0E0FNV6_ORYNI
MIGGGCFGDGGIGGDRRGGSSDLFPSLTYPIGCSLPSRTDPPSAAMGGADPVTSSPPSHIPSLLSGWSERRFQDGGRRLTCGSADEEAMAVGSCKSGLPINFGIFGTGGYLGSYGGLDGYDNTLPGIQIRHCEFVIPNTIEVVHGAALGTMASLVLE